MQNSLTMLQDESDEYSNRCRLLEDVKNKFETLMSAEIIAAFNSKSIETAKSYVQIFGQMNRIDELKMYYYQCEKLKILERNAALISELNNMFDKQTVNFSLEPKSLNENADSLKELLNKWLDYSVEIWHSEVNI